MDEVVKNRLLEKSGDNLPGDAIDSKFHSYSLYPEFHQEGLIFLQRGTIQGIDPTVTQILGHTPESITNQPIAELVRPAERKHLEQALIDGAELQLEMRHKNNRYLPLRISVKPVSDAAYSFDCVIRCSPPTTPYKVPQTAVDYAANPSTTWNDYFQLSNSLCFTINHSGFFTELNPAWQSIFGFDADELTSKPLLDFIHPEDKENFQSEIDYLLHHNLTTTPIFTRFLTRSGSYRWLQWNITGFPQSKLLCGVANDITVVKQTELSLQHNRLQLEQRLDQHLKELSVMTQRYNILSENVADSIFIHDDTGHIIDCNQHTLSSLGYSHEELRNLTIFDIDPDIERDNVVSHLFSNASNSETLFAARHQRKDGSFAEVEIKRNAYIQEGKKYFVVVCRDISDRKQNELALRESEARFRLLADQAPAMIWMTDRKFNAIWFNKRWLEYTGRGLEKLAGGGWLESIHLEDKDSAERYFNWAYEHQQRFDREVRLLNADGNYGWIAVTGIPRCDESGRFLGYIVYNWDISDRKRAQRALMESENRFRTLSTHAPVGIFQTDTTGACTFVNEKWEQLTGLHRQDALGLGWTKALHPNDRERVFAKWERFLELGGEFSLEYRFLHKNDHVVWVHGRAIPIIDNTKNMVGILGTISDITESQTAQAQILAAKEEAEFANHAKSHFLARMSHELRTPLNAILGFGQLLQINTDNFTEDQKEGVQHIMEGGQHLLHLINDVLDITTVDAGEMKLAIKPVNIRNTLDSCLLILKPLAEKHRVTLAPLGSDCDCHVYADQQRLKQVFINLISNAIKYNREGGTVSIQCLASPMSSTTTSTTTPSQITPPPAIRISVQDTGIGIKMADQEKIFEPFQRITLSVEHIDGTGIGLNITKKMVELMQGSIGCDSEYQKGSTFWCELPAASIGAKATFSENELALNILCIEDNPANSRLMQEIFAQTTACHLVCAETAEKGIEIAQLQQPDIILMDIDLPGMAGVEAAEILRNFSNTKHIPIVGVSGFLEQCLEEQQLTRFDAYLTKPINVDELLQTIKSLVR
ncbi:MAG: PAS domain S-box protein [Gammaproteobacteria bacterium]|nr:PAS domain S-box protein [Gammaproteobacteria bacterium]MDH5802168.1 PAS domain S-box protein [Gammaproteobacteria bacterium]